MYYMVSGLFSAVLLVESVVFSIYALGSAVASAAAGGVAVSS